MALLLHSEALGPALLKAETSGLKHHENDADLRHLFTIAGRVRFSFQAASE